MEKQKLNQEKKERIELVRARGRVFQGTIVKKFAKRVVVEFERTVYVPKYERYYKKKTRLHSRLPKEINAEVGDYVKVQECRPLSKIIHSVVIEKIRSKGEVK
ncbi:MAG: 30S ribosomal protein S17 [Nanoarchaeota archaeon]|nr:30S ribosomal protein S17 [Nanoarchaeota archaeon]